MQNCNQNKELKLPRGVVLAQAKEQARNLRHVQKSDEVNMAWLEDLIKEKADEDFEPPPTPTHLSKIRPFDTEGAHEQVKLAHSMVLEFAASVLKRGSSPHWLSLLGGCGCGKTHLVKLARALLLDSGIHAQMWKWRNILDRLRSGNGDLMRHLAELRVLIIDDVGAEFTATGRALDFSMSTLLELQDEREGKWTILTSNMSLENIANAEERVASRLLRDGGEVVRMDAAPDFAFTHAKARGAVKGKITPNKQ